MIKCLDKMTTINRNNFNIINLSEGRSLSILPYGTPIQNYQPQNNSKATDEKEKNLNRKYAIALGLATVIAGIFIAVKGRGAKSISKANLNLENKIKSVEPENVTNKFSSKPHTRSSKVHHHSQKKQSKSQSTPPPSPADIKIIQPELTPTQITDSKLPLPSQVDNIKPTEAPPPAKPPEVPHTADIEIIQPELTPATILDSKSQLPPHVDNVEIKPPEELPLAKPPVINPELELPQDNNLISVRQAEPMKLPDVEISDEMFNVFHSQIKKVLGSNSLWDNLFHKDAKQNIMNQINKTNAEATLDILNIKDKKGNSTYKKYLLELDILPHLTLENSDFIVKILDLVSNSRHYPYFYEFLGKGMKVLPKIEPSNREPVLKLFKSGFENNIKPDDLFKAIPLIQEIKEESIAKLFKKTRDFETFILANALESYRLILAKRQYVHEYIADKDPKILDYVNKNLDINKDCFDIKWLLEAYIALKGCCYHSCRNLRNTKQFYAFVTKNPDIVGATRVKKLTSLGDNHPMSVDFRNEPKTEMLKKAFYDGYPNIEMAEHLYYKHYLTTEFVPLDAIEICKRIAETYGTKIFFSAENEGCESLKYVEKEFKAWKQAGGEHVRFPRVLDFSKINCTYAKPNRKIDKYTTVAVAYSGKKIGIDGADLSHTKWALRHEMTHCNTTATEEKKIYKKAYYREEFKKAGLSDASINYALTDRTEFLAVSAEGDMSKYSPKFKKVLIKFGMPEWVFKLPK